MNKIILRSLTISFVLFFIVSTDASYAQDDAKTKKLQDKVESAQQKLDKIKQMS